MTQNTACKVPKKIETLVLSFQEYQTAKDDKKILPKYFFIDAMGSYIFIKTRDRAKAQAFIDEECGQGKYRVRTYVQDGAASGEATCRAVATRRGQHVANTSFGIPHTLR